MKAYHGFELPEKITGARAVYIDVIYPARAEEILRLCAWDKQRTVRKRKIDFYAKAMTRDEWMDGTVLEIAWIYEEDRFVLVDGQHRLSAVVLANAPQKFVLSIVAVSHEELAAPYYASRDRGMMRSAYDQLHALDVDTLYGWNKTQINSFKAAVEFAGRDFLPGSTPDLTVQQQVDLLDAYDVYCDWYYDLMSEKMAGRYMRSALLRRATLAVGIVTMRYSAGVYGQSKVNDFWEKVMSGEDLAKGDPRMVAHKHLIESSISGGGNLRGRVVTAPESSRILANCFNAWTEGRSLNFTRVFQDRITAPISINGSPYDGKSLRIDPIVWR